ncbi:hypothetical protein [Mesorhizobium huakuii]|uniref:Uncharacterized protein n=1 Tax=Mesorhizobium huakuii TaxID=28104 RepID=A0A7G6SZD0_9HYPH|nr:hypothetical protein [Mesorhizobium huakuii]QND59862.1 hypothetical protein HB778_27370 [Mesorhizobium huakuii]
MTVLDEGQEFHSSSSAANAEQPPTTWRFKLGQCISHKDQILPSLVMGRVKTSKGREVYGLRSFMNVDPNRDRMILGDSLVDVVPGSEPCLECLLHQTALCPACWLADA